MKIIIIDDLKILRKSGLNVWVAWPVIGWKSCLSVEEMMSLATQSSPEDWYEN